MTWRTDAVPTSLIFSHSHEDIMGVLIVYVLACDSGVIIK